jgi:hypothetical protein
VSWYAFEAFRIRVSMSAIGSVMVMSVCFFLTWFPRTQERLRTCGDSPYQLLFVTPGSSPR